MNQNARLARITTSKAVVKRTKGIVRLYKIVSTGLIPPQTPGAVKACDYVYPNCYLLPHHQANFSFGFGTTENLIEEQPHGKER